MVKDSNNDQLKESLKHKCGVHLAFTVHFNKRFISLPVDHPVNLHLVKLSLDEKSDRKKMK